MIAPRGWPTSTAAPSVSARPASRRRSVASPRRRRPGAGGARPRAPRSGTEMTSDPRVIAARLGIDESTVRQLQARGHLLRLDATDAEIRERLLVGQVRALHPRDVPRERRTTG